MSGKAQWQNSRQVIERIIITGTLVLDTPAHFGSGDTEGLVDIPLLYDPLDGSPLLTGASIAGALRNYLREYDEGYGWAENPRSANKSRAERLFGYLDDSKPEKKASVQSWLMIDDARGQPPAEGAEIELRDGVAIDAATRTVETRGKERGQKYDVELLAAGTTFPLVFELWLTEKHRESSQLDALVTALRGFEPKDGEQSGEIGLGLRKRRGFGECHVTGWQTMVYDLTTPQGLIDWLADDRSKGAQGLPPAKIGQDARQCLRMEATFEVAGSLLIRSDTGEADSPDMIHLRSYRRGRQKPILSGTSVAGAIRARALRIANTVLGRDKGQALVDEMFGRRIYEPQDKPSGSLVTVRETELRGRIANLVQSRVKIDRFTGGSYPAALFSQQAVWGQEAGQDGQALVGLDLTLRRPVWQAQRDFEAGAGLLLLVLKDLWTGDLPLGGESSVGRGRLRGKFAKVIYGDKMWTISTDGGDGLVIQGARHELERWVIELAKWQGKLDEQSTKKEESK